MRTEWVIGLQGGFAKRARLRYLPHLVHALAWYFELVFGLNALLLVACGALLSIALPAVAFWPLLVALIPLFVLTAQSERLRDAFGYGFFFGLGFFTLYILWLPISFVELFGPAFWITFPPLLAIVASFWGIVTWLSRLIGGQGRGTLWTIPALWVLMEWARTQGYFAFPWGTLGYAWLETPIIQLADIAGIYGVSLFTTSLLALISAPFVIDPRSRSMFERNTPSPTPVIVALGLCLMVLFYCANRTLQILPEANQRALLVQGDTDPLGRAVGSSDDLTIYSDLSAQINDRVDLVVWPEGAVPIGNLERADRLSVRDRIQLSAGGANVITGSYASNNSDSFNVVYSLNNSQVIGRYDKVALVPFGERFPFINALQPLYRTIFSWFGLPMLRGTSPGEEIQPIALVEGQAGAYICYESVFPRVSRLMVNEGAEVLINISNDAWFGRGMGAEQHFDMGRVRAIETRRYLLRVGNDGITGLVDPLGRVHATLPRGDRDSLIVNYGLTTARTPYVRFGNVLILILIIYILGFSVSRIFFDLN